jgi:hypothetical protein
MGMLCLMRLLTAGTMLVNRQCVMHVRKSVAVRQQQCMSRCASLCYCIDTPQQR